MSALARPEPNRAPVTLDSIRACLEGVIPVAIATLAPDGTPNVTYISQVHYIDPGHVGLSYQFFNKTRANLLANPRARLLLIDPVTARSYRMTIVYERTETGGPLFESMRAKLAGIASHSGMAGVFRLAGADICRVEAIEPLPGDSLPPRQDAPGLLSALRNCCRRLAAEQDLGTALDRLMDVIGDDLGIGHAALFLCDPDGRTLYAVASRGYEASGIGAEIAVGDGVIGMAARERTPIRIGRMTDDVDYARGVGARLGAGGAAPEIPLPGLERPSSQLAVPVEDGGGLLGVLFVESERDLRFTYDHEDALAVMAAQLAAVLRRTAGGVAPARKSAAQAGPLQPAAGAVPLDVRHYRFNDSVFVGDDYLIKGVAGAIFRILLAAHAHDGRCEFTNRELRLHPELRLPAHAENLEARLILLERRLAEKDCGIGIEKTGRGRFRLCLARPVRLHEIQAEAPTRDQGG
ncbi:MAG: GAF domain-containing protein [Alphaproteobacteria bacterium]